MTNPISLLYDITLGMVDREDARRGKLAVEAKMAECEAYQKANPRQGKSTLSRWNGIL
jgi:hypothetical protein